MVETIAYTAFMNETKILGTITENHLSEIESVFGADLAAKVEAAKGTTFLDLLFENFAQKPVDDSVSGR